MPLCARLNGHLVVAGLWLHWFIVMAFGLVLLGPHCLSFLQLSSVGLIMVWFLGVSGIILPSPCNTSTALKKSHNQGQIRDGKLTNGHGTRSQQVLPSGNEFVTATKHRHTSGAASICPLTGHTIRWTQCSNHEQGLNNKPTNSTGAHQFCSR